MNPSPGGPYWTPITPKTGSFFHADSQLRRGKLDFEEIARELDVEGIEIDEEEEGED